MHHLSAVNVLVKYADDTNLVVAENTHLPLADEYAKINPEKTKELVFR